MESASIIVDLHHLRCRHCKVALHDELAKACPVCGAVFDSVMSNHVGLAERLRRRRETGWPRGREGASQNRKLMELEARQFDERKAVRTLHSPIFVRGASRLY